MSTTQAYATGLSSEMLQPPPSLDDSKTMSMDLHHPRSSPVEAKTHSGRLIAPHMLAIPKPVQMVMSPVASDFMAGFATHDTSIMIITDSPRSGNSQMSSSTGVAATAESDATDGLGGGGVDAGAVDDRPSSPPAASAGITGSVTQHDADAATEGLPTGHVSAGIVSVGQVSAGIVSVGQVSAGIVSAGLVSAGATSADLGKQMVQAGVKGEVEGKADGPVEGGGEEAGGGGVMDATAVEEQAVQHPIDVDEGTDAAAGTDTAAAGSAEVGATANIGVAEPVPDTSAGGLSAGDAGPGPTEGGDAAAGGQGKEEKTGDGDGADAPHECRFFSTYNPVYGQEAARLVQDEAAEAAAAEHAGGAGAVAERSWLRRKQGTGAVGAGGGFRRFLCCGSPAAAQVVN